MTIQKDSILGTDVKNNVKNKTKDYRSGQYYLTIYTSNKVEANFSDICFLQLEIPILIVFTFRKKIFQDKGLLFLSNFASKCLLLMWAIKSS